MLQKEYTVTKDGLQTISQDAVDLMLATLVKAKVITKEQLTEASNYTILINDRQLPPAKARGLVRH